MDNITLGLFVGGVLYIIHLYTLAIRLNRKLKKQATEHSQSIADVVKELNDQRNKDINTIQDNFNQVEKNFKEVDQKRSTEKKQTEKKLRKLDVDIKRKEPQMYSRSRFKNG